MAVLIMRILCVIGFVFTGTLLALDLKKKFATKEGKAQWDKEMKFFKYNSVVAVVTNFFDVLGIGSFATNSALFKLRGSVDDVNIPGTLNVGDTFPVLFEAFVFLKLVELDPLTLICMIGAAVIGSTIGAGIVTKWDQRKVRWGMGIALFVVAFMMICRQLHIGPFGMSGVATSLRGTKLVIAILVNFLLGALMSMGIGMYAGCMALVSILGMNVTACFPIMMGSSAYLMSFGNSPKFIKESRYDMVATVTQATFGMVGALLAYFLVKSLPLDILFWIVVAVVFYTSFTFLRDAMKGDKE
jgi:uncharacterized membrane protein YfcA